MNNNLKKKIKIICTVGPSSLNDKFIKFSNKNIDLLRLNMSHLSISELEKNISYIKKRTNCPICIDTEGAQIRTKFRKKIFCKNAALIKINKNDLALYPEYI